ncbi:SPX domain-containing protein [Mycena sanguinolenta]|nr:SPX domain-containing protein [Mycena sanguinolenta]
MKFTRYLEDTQATEWKRAYIDYRIFKERIHAIQRVQDGSAFHVESYSNSQLNHQAGSMLSVIVQSESGENSFEASSVHIPLERRDPSFIPPSRGQVDGSGRPLTPRLGERRLSFHRSHTSHTSHNNESIPPGPSPSPTTRNPRIILPPLVVQPTNGSPHAVPSPVAETGTLNGGRRRNRPPLNHRHSNTTHTSHSHVPPSPAVSPSIRDRIKGIVQRMDPLRRPPDSSVSLQGLIPLLSSHELAFFSALDSEVQKIEDFYVAREKEMKARTKSLEAQLRELNEHRKLFDAAHPAISRSWTAFFKSFIPPFRRKLPFRATHMEDSGEIPEESIAVDVEAAGLKKDKDHIEITPMPDHLDPKAYLAARRKLKKAVLEHYRGLEMLHNYRILNIYGIRRVLNKFEKATKINAQRAYMEAKVERCAFCSDETRVMMDQIQNTFAASFAEGDKKKAITRLRAGPEYKSHHNSTFCSGLAIGSAVAALALGIAHIFEQKTRDAIPGWDGLLFIYGVLAVPTIFALIVGLNLLVWARARINYVFIFGKINLVYFYFVRG